MPGATYATGTEPNSIVATDWNRDGKLDLAVANYFSGTVTLFQNNGSGVFTSSSVIVGGNLRGIVAGDWNGDGRPDLAVTKAGSGVQILLGDGTGSFPQSFIALGNSSQALTTADFNGDGKPDLAVAGPQVTVLLGNGTGGFAQASGSPILAGTDPVSIAATDLNGDGFADLAVANATSNNVTVLLGNGTGAFTQAAGSPVAAGNKPYWVATGDLNGNGKPDLVVANRNTSNVTVLLGNGSGTFVPAPASPLSVGTNVYFVALADLNRDGQLDLATAKVKQQSFCNFA